MTKKCYINKFYLKTNNISDLSLYEKYISFFEELYTKENIFNPENNVFELKLFSISYYNFLDIVDCFWFLRKRKKSRGSKLKNTQI